MMVGQVLVRMSEILMWLSLALLAAGLYRPWWVLWWQATQNRLGVIRLYGTLALAAWLLGRLPAIM